MPKDQGQFVWFELMTADDEAAATFYGDVIGWTAKRSDEGGTAYTELHADGAGVGGILALTPEMRANGARPGWTGYISTRDLDDGIARLSAAGGTLYHGPQDIPGVGRFAVVADPQGTVFQLFQPHGGQPPPERTGPGHVGWHELRAVDGPGAFAFYADQFGWTASGAMDMGPMGTYQMFATDTEQVGGIMTRSDDRPPHWLFYVQVTDLEASISRAVGRGGTLTNGPMEVPGGQRIAHLTDPEGVLFALVTLPSANGPV